MGDGQGQALWPPAGASSPKARTNMHVLHKYVDPLMRPQHDPAASAVQGSETQLSFCRDLIMACPTWATTGAYLAVAQTSCYVVSEQPRQQEGQQVLKLRQVVLQRRAGQHDAPPAPARQRPQPLRPRRVSAGSCRVRAWARFGHVSMTQLLYGSIPGTLQQSTLMSSGR